jgi:hypothetical protein
VHLHVSVKGRQPVGRDRSLSGLVQNSPMRRLKLPLIVFAVLAGLSALFSRLSGLSFWTMAAILAAAWLINGLVATVEDDVPGGFNNPDGTATPLYVVILKWLVRAVAALAIFGCATLAYLIFRDS